MKLSARLLGSLALFIVFSLGAYAETQVVVKGLFSGAAVLEINGRQTLLKNGKTSDEGVRLINATSKQAVLEIDGKRRTLGLSQSIGTAYSEASVKEVRLNSQHRGHHFGSGKFNGKTAQFLVDTGASTVSMSSAAANRLGIQYKKGKIVRVSTAQGVTRGYQIVLSRVEVGTIRVNKVAAIIIEGEYPLDILLGNSFLSQTDMSVQNGVMILRSKF